MYFKTNGYRNTSTRPLFPLVQLMLSAKELLEHRGLGGKQAYTRFGALRLLLTGCIL
ncbi:unnamed protein product [Musa acuminata subsp. malaccensis]|uniref:Uncharacterized protein n=1 Tax=Musa acuminata subsp. malaccensis TaxID=214687 RepID=A0A804V5P9_MUSAM|nr:unnamed protein product [Musa acuminata subsp. malaccensis]CAG1865752.1 unnamed protein product [Musa acuminata subsp. malaccensis]